MTLLDDPIAIAIICFALFAGGVLKGAIGMGAPVVAVPVMVSFIDVRVAVALMVFPNMITNLWQLWAYRAHRLPGSLPMVFAIAGAVGAAIGSLILTSVSANSLKILVAVAVMLYVALRLLRPNFALSIANAKRLAAPIGIIAGILQGAAGVSAPVSASFVSALRLSREIFIVTISLFFVAMTIVQIPLLSAMNVMTPQVIVLSLAALAPLLIGMPIGGQLAKLLSPKLFDRIILGVLTLLALKLIFDATYGYLRRDKADCATWHEASNVAPLCQLSDQ